MTDRSKQQTVENIEALPRHKLNMPSGKTDDVAIGDLASTAKGSGARRNSGKVEFSLIPFQLLAGTARVLMSGKLKYQEWNWAKGIPYAATFDCLLRHLIKWFYCREECDPETGEHHLDLAMCNLLFLRHYSMTFPDGDDRPPAFTDFDKWLPDVNTPFDAEDFIQRNPYLLDEEWKPVVGYEGYYEVSDKGRVRSLQREINTFGGIRVIEGQMLQSIETDQGYFVVFLSKKGKSKQKKIHHLVLQSFVGTRPKGLDGCHNDGVKSNNTRGNLRWDTRSANLKDKFKHGFKNANERKVRRSDGKIFDSATEAANSVGTSQGNISTVCRGERNTSKGYGWEYI